jgi:uncharacterized membrane protein YoaK (UPF0700 family)
MSTDLKIQPEPTKTALVTGIISDAQDLLKQQFELLKHEVRADLRITLEAVLAFAAGAILAFAGVLMMALMLTYLLQWAVPQLELWACFGIVGFALLVVSAGLAYAGKLKLESFRNASNEAMHALKENVQWITNPK